MKLHKIWRRHMAIVSMAALLGMMAVPFSGATPAIAQSNAFSGSSSAKALEISILSGTNSSQPSPSFQQNRMPAPKMPEHPAVAASLLGNLIPDVTSAVSDTISGISQTVNQTVSNVVNTVENTVSSITSSSNPVAGVTSAVNSLVSGTTATLGQTASGVTSTVGNGMTDLSTTVGDLTSSVSEVASNPLSGLISGVGNLTTPGGNTSTVSNSQTSQTSLGTTTTQITATVGDVTSVVASALDLRGQNAGLAKVELGVNEARLNSSEQPAAQSSAYPLGVQLLGSGNIIPLSANSSAPPDSQSHQSLSSVQAGGVSAKTLKADTTAIWQKGNPAATSATSVANVSAPGLVNIGAVETNSSVNNESTGGITSVSHIHLANVSIAGIVNINSLSNTVTATATGKPGGATAQIDAPAVQLSILGIPYTITAGQTIQVPGIAKVAFANGQKQTSADGKNSMASASGLEIQLLGAVFNGITIKLGAVQATAQDNENGAPIQTPYTLEKSADQTKVKAGDTITYHLTYSIQDQLSQVRVKDPLPEHTSFVNADNGGRYDPAQNAVIWDLGNKQKGDQGNLTFQVKVDAQTPTGTVLRNVAVISAAQQPSQSSQTVDVTVDQGTNNGGGGGSPGSGGSSGSSSGGGGGSGPSSPYDLAKTAEQDTVMPGGTITYHLVYKINQALNQVIIKDVLPEHTQLISADGGGQYDAAQNAVVWNLGSQENGKGGVLTFQVKVDPSVAEGTVIRNVAVIAADQKSPQSSQTVEVTVGPKEHIPFIFGFPDGTYRPDEWVTRAQIASMVDHILQLENESNQSVPFTDVPSSHWAKGHIAAVTAHGIFSGYGSSSSFRPDQPMTRAELACVMIRMHDVSPVLFAQLPGTPATFRDVSSQHWAYNAIETAAQLGFLSGYPDGHFGPDEPITRAQVVAMLDRALGRGPLINGKITVQQHFPDVLPEDWYFGWVEESATIAHKGVHQDAGGEALDSYLTK